MIRSVYVDKKILKILAGFVWYTGFLALMIKSLTLFREAYLLDSNLWKFGLIFLFTSILIIVKTKYIFIKTCQKNLNRIDALENPKIWEFYRVRFFIFLGTMISLGAYLSGISHGNYWFLVGIGILDMSVGFSLLFSSFVFWTR